MIKKIYVLIYVKDKTPQLSQQSKSPIKRDIPMIINDNYQIN
jgi:hypothetical protein